ncbi:hypothetical protein [Sphingomonas koreensis]
MMLSASIALSIILASHGYSVVADKRDENIVKVSGLLDADREYPLFLTDDVAGRRSFPFEISEKKWRDFYSVPLAAALKNGLEPVCFQIVGEGYVTNREPTNRWPANKKFVFTKVMKLELLPSSAACAAYFP